MFLQAKAVDTQLSEEKEREVSRRQEAVSRNRQILQRIFNVVRFIARLSLPFRGIAMHRDISDAAVSGCSRLP